MACRSHKKIENHNYRIEFNCMIFIVSSKLIKLVFVYCGANKLDKLKLCHSLELSNMIGFWFYKQVFISLQCMCRWATKDVLISFYNQCLKVFFSPENLSQHWIVRRVIRLCKIFGRFSGARLPPPTEICDTDLCIIWCAFSSSWKEEISAADARENLQKKLSETSFHSKWKKHL